MQEFFSGGVCYRGYSADIGNDSMFQLCAPAVRCAVRGVLVSRRSEVELCWGLPEQFMEFLAHAGAKAVPVFDTVSDISVSPISASYPGCGLSCLSTTICQD